MIDLLVNCDPSVPLACKHFTNVDVSVLVLSVAVPFHLILAKCSLEQYSTFANVFSSAVGLLACVDLASVSARVTVPDLYLVACTCDGYRSM